MKRYIVIGVNDNPKYAYYLPLILCAWRSLGWDVMILYAGKSDATINYLMKVFDGLHKLMSKELQQWFRLVIIGLDPILGFKSETVAQCSRLYACCGVHDSVFLMTSDADMLPLSDYWQVKATPLYTDRNGSGKHFMSPRVHAWGRDLTDYHYPICYLGATSKDWKTFMKIDQFDIHAMLRRDMREQPHQWVLDQDILTERLLAHGKEKISHISRGIDMRTGYPVGRVDRSSWRMDHPKLIDAHLPHDTLTNKESYEKVWDLVNTVWPNAGWGWFENYTKEFKKIAKL